MGRKVNRKPGRPSSETPHRPAPATRAAAATAPALVVAGAVFAGLALVMSLLLALEHLGGLSLPGCGEESACARVTKSVWGNVPLPGFAWPVSHLGLAYFCAAFVAWLATRGRVPQLFRHLVRLGVVASVGFGVIIVIERLPCLYCIAAHVGNLAFWIVVECTRPNPRYTRAALASVAGVFVLATAVLIVPEARVRQKLERERAAAARQIIEATHRPPTPTPPAQPATQPAETKPASPVTSAPAVPATAPAASSSAPARTGWFTGRYVVGPEDAPIRIVMFTGYQCPDCAMIERQLVRLQETRNDISIAIKHFPFNVECNPNVKGMHQPNACWAARAAEAAGIRWGPEGFWKVHKWLFERQGVFETTDQLEGGLRQLGFDPTGFVQLMSSERTLQNVRADCAEAQLLGLHFTPMIFINGVELKGWSVPMALVRTVEEVAATNPPRRTAEFDRPPPAFEKYVADWRDQKVLELAPDASEWVLGPPDGTIRVVLWGDYQEAGSQESDRIVRNFVAQRNNVRYTFRHYPFNGDCNERLKERRHPQACRASQAAEAAGRLGGNDAYWKMHAWLMENPSLVKDDVSLQAAAAACGLEGDTLLAALGRADVQAAIADDIEAGAKLPVLRLGMPAGLHAIPTIFVNGRYIPRWRMDDRPVLPAILEEAAGAAKP